MVNMANSADVNMGFFPLEFSTCGADSEALAVLVVVVGGGGGGGGVEEKGGEVGGKGRAQDKFGGFKGIGR